MIINTETNKKDIVLTVVKQTDLESKFLIPNIVWIGIYRCFIINFLN